MLPAEDDHPVLPGEVRERLLASARFREGLAELAREVGRDQAAVLAEVTGYLEEMVTGWSRHLVGVWVRLARFNVRRSYDAGLDLDPAQVERVRAAAGDGPLVFLPSHKSNLDSLAMSLALHESGLPRTVVVGGANMAFWPMGTLFRHAGLVYIRRTAGGNPIYRWALRQYVGHLVEERTSLQFYLEGGRSRTGKLLPPRLGLLSYLVDAYRQGRTEDVVLVPVSIAYDQLQEVRDFAREAQGAGKRTESVAWLLQAIREQRGRFGRIYVRFGEPLSVRAALADGGRGEDERLPVHKLALEVSRRINEVTPITATSLVTLALLGAQGRALTLDQVKAAVHDPLRSAVDRGLPLTRDLDLDTDAGVLRALCELERHGVVVAHSAGPEAVFVIGQDQHLAAAFYRNTVVHFFLHGAIAQAALGRVARLDPADPVAVFWDTAFAVRDLLKFEFFFEPRDAFRRALADELHRHRPDWEPQLAAGHAQQVLSAVTPHTAHTVLRSFLEANAVVAAALVRHGGDALSEDALLRLCLELGRQYLLQQRVHSPESLAQPLFVNALRLAGGRKLLGEEADRDGQRRWLDELRDVLRDVEVVEELATDRVLALMNGGTVAAPLP